MRKFSKILESADSDIVLDIKDILMDFKDAGFDVKIDEAHGTYVVQLSAKGTPEAPAVKIDMMELLEMISVANERIKDLGMSYDAGDIKLSGKSNSSNAFIKLQYRKEEFTANKDVHGWKEFKAYCEKVLGIEGMQGRDPFYFRINVVDKDNGWPGLPDDKAGWSIEVDEYPSDNDRDRFVATFPGYEDFLKKLLGRQIKYSLVWHLVSDEGDRHHRISDPVKLEELQKKHNPMKFDKEGIEAVETLLEMAEKFPDKIEIKKHNI